MSYAGHYWTPATRDGQLQAPPARDTGWWYCIQCGTFGSGEGGFCPKYGDLERSERDIAWRTRAEPVLQDVYRRLMFPDYGPENQFRFLLDQISAVLNSDEEQR